MSNFPRQRQKHFSQAAAAYDPADEEARHRNMMADQRVDADVRRLIRETSDAGVAAAAAAAATAAAAALRATGAHPP